MTVMQEQIDTKVKSSNIIRTKIAELFNTAETKYNTKLKLPSICVTEKPAENKSDNVLYLIHQDLDSPKFEKILNRKITTLICIQLFGKNFKSHERRILKQKLGIVSKLRNPEKYKGWRWELRDAQLAREHGLSRERISQIREALSK
jgi:hypothetical protein